MYVEKRQNFFLCAQVGGLGNYVSLIILHLQKADFTVVEFALVI